jgi:arylformamidase
MNPDSSDQGIWLSHPWGPSCPAYGGGSKIEITSMGNMANGDTSNSLKFSASNHIGTHMDAPRHFITDGRSVDSYSPAELCFSSPCIFDVKLAENIRHVGITHLESQSDVAKKIFYSCDLLLIRTGAEAFRNDERYWKDGFGLGLGLADYIRQHAPLCRAIGIDTISITAFSDRILGRKVHNEFLGGGKPFFLVEDMSLKNIENASLKTVIVAPLRIEDGDGAPVSVMGYCHRGIN